MSELYHFSLTPKEKNELLANLVYRKGRKLGSNSLVLEIIPGSPSSKRPFFFLGNTSFSKEFSVEQPVYFLPINFRADNPTKYIEALAKLYVDEIRSVQPDGPYLLGGFCFGGWVAFEIAQKLQAQGEKVALLVPIEIRSSDPVYHFCRRILRSLKYDWRNILRLSPSQLLKYVLRLAKSVLYKIIFKLIRTFKKNDENKEDIEPHIKNNYQQQVKKSRKIAIQSYIPQRYSGRVALFFASECNTRSFLYPKGGLGKLFTGEVDVYVVPGGHTSLLKEQMLAENLRGCIDKAQIEFSESARLCEQDKSI